MESIIRDIRIPLEQEEKEDCYDPKRVSNFGIIFISSMKVMVIKVETYHLMNILIKLTQT